MKEIWAPVKGYEGLYEVSSFGRVRSLSYRRTGKMRVLNLDKNNAGYLIVKLHKNGKGKIYQVHRLVAYAFIPNWFDEQQVNHRDENKQNNHVTNLEWCSAKYNNNYGTARKRMVEKQSKTVLQLTKTGEIVKEWFSTMEAGRNGFDNSSISKCCLGKIKSYKGYIWRYK